MKKSTLKILKEVYDKQTLGVFDAIKMVSRITNDHRDFYPLASLISSGYLGFTGPIPDSPKFADTYMTHLLQAWAQGDGPQIYKSAHTMGGTTNDNSYFYLGGKGLEYLSDRKADRDRILVVAIISLLSALIVAVASEPIKRYLNEPHAVSSK
ncbi:hypothetical protein [Pseudomonas sp. RIT411]|uniref:hypothetical protein n=1 Tax=Pseudomonas sp. RIT411 TaxID=2202160 RepID=UPI0011BEC28E|nr:hypothetical protein [Pseudomonas sp. RIT 411]